MIGNPTLTRPRTGRLAIVMLVLSILALPQIAAQRADAALPPPSRGVVCKSSGGIEFLYSGAVSLRDPNTSACTTYSQQTWGSANAGNTAVCRGTQYANIKYEVSTEPVLWTPSFVANLRTFTLTYWCNYKVFAWISGVWVPWSSGSLKAEIRYETNCLGVWCAPRVFYSAFSCNYFHSGCKLGAGPWKL